MADSSITRICYKHHASRGIPPRETANKRRFTYSWARPKSRENCLNFLHAVGLLEFGSERVKILYVAIRFVVLADFIQPLLDCDLLKAIEAPPAPKHSQE